MDEAPYPGTDENNYVWATPYAYRATQSASDTPSAAYKQSTTGFIMGLDRPVSETLRLGGAFLVENSSLTGQNTQTQDVLTMTSYQLTGYAKQKLTPLTDINFIANLTTDQNKSSRVNTLVNDIRSANASYNGWHGLLSAEVDHRIEVGQHTISALVRLDYGVAHISAYNESGAGLYNLSVNAQTQSSTIASVGVKYRYDLDLESRIVARASVGHDFSANPASAMATDGFGISFTSQVNNPASLVIQAGVGYEMQTKDNVRVRISYDYLGRKNGYSNSMLNASVVVPF